MDPTDTNRFVELLAGVYGFYSKDLSRFSIEVWTTAMRPYDFAAVKDALNRHCINAEGGQWVPKPADVVKLIEGGSQDAALLAWSKVDRAVRLVGPHQSVCFDDPIIHAVIRDMGGWGQICSKTDDEWPFVGNEFQTRYRGYRLRRSDKEFPRALIGIAEAQNRREGFAPPDVILIGDAARAQQVHSEGSDAAGIVCTPLKKLRAAIAVGHGTAQSASDKQSGAQTELREGPQFELEESDA